MTADSPADADDAVRRRRLAFRAWHRGIREMDLVMGRFADAYAATMPSSDLDLFEALLEAPDPDVFSWITGTKPTPANYDTSLLHQIRDYHTAEGPKRG